MSAKPWRLDVDLHHLGPSAGGMLPARHTGIGGQETKMMRGTPFPCDNGGHEIHHGQRSPLELHRLGAEINNNLGDRRTRLLHQPNGLHRLFYLLHQSPRELKEPSRRTNASGKCDRGTVTCYSKNCKIWCFDTLKCECVQMVKSLKRATGSAFASPPIGATRAM